MQIKVGSLAKMCDINLALFSWPRSSGSKLYFSLGSLYSAMALTQFVCESWRWSFTGREKWIRICNEHHIEDSFEFSMATGKQDDDKVAKKPVHEGVLPFTAISPPALMLLLDRWAYRSEKKCGFRDIAHKHNARGLIAALLSLLWEHGPWRLRLDVVRAWVDVWPRPPTFINPISMVVTDGIVDLCEWAAVAQEHGKSSFSGSSWLLILSRIRQPCQFIDFLEVIGDPDLKLTGLVSQVFVACGRKLQEVLCANARKGSTSGIVSVNRVSLEDMFDKRRRLDCFLYKYIVSAKRRCSGQQFWSMCTDKASCGGYNLQAGFAVFPNNLAVIPPPAVLQNIQRPRPPFTTTDQCKHEVFCLAYFLVEKFGPKRRHVMSSPQDRKVCGLIRSGDAVLCVLVGF